MRGVFIEIRASLPRFSPLLSVLTFCLYPLPNYLPPFQPLCAFCSPTGCSVALSTKMSSVKARPEPPQTTTSPASPAAPAASAAGGEGELQPPQHWTAQPLPGVGGIFLRCGFKSANHQCHRTTTPTRHWATMLPARRHPFRPASCSTGRSTGGPTTAIEETASTGKCCVQGVGIGYLLHGTDSLSALQKGPKRRRAKRDIRHPVRPDTVAVVLLSRNANIG